MKPTLTNDFFFGGKAVFTVQNNQSGEHRTYKIRKGKPNPRYPNPAWFIKQMTGTDNESHYSDIGKVDDRTGNITLTRFSIFTDYSKQMIAARWIMARIVNGLDFPDFFEIRHSGKCGRCGRTLTTPASLDIGLGPECVKIIGRFNQ